MGAMILEERIPRRLALKLQGRPLSSLPLIIHEMKPTCHCSESDLWWHFFLWEHSSTAYPGCPGSSFEWPHQLVETTRSASTVKPKEDDLPSWPTVLWETGNGTCWFEGGKKIKREQRNFACVGKTVEASNRENGWKSKTQLTQYFWLLLFCF